MKGMEETSGTGTGVLVAIFMSPTVVEIFHPTT